MLTLGVTGGVGSGKSTVLKYIFDKYNADIIFCDNLAKTLIAENEELKHKIINTFNNYKISDNNGDILNDKLSEVVFNDEKMLIKLNNLIHPAVKNEVIKKINELALEGKKDLLIIEAALLLEEEYDKIFPCIYVYADEQTRLYRLGKNRGYSLEKSKSIMANQLGEETFRKRCTYTIDNSSDKEETYRQIDLLLQEIYHLRRKNG